jgi:RNA polymerase sigma factor for flagellar operon FliA
MLNNTSAAHSPTVAYQPKHTQLVRMIAHHIHRRLPSSVELDVLVSAGHLGLLNAQDRFDPSRAVPFEAFARIHIRGAIVDSLRQLDWVPRSVRRKAQTLRREEESFESSRGRRPSRSEVAERLHMSPDEVSTLRREAFVPRLLSLDQPLSEEGNGTLIDTVPAPEQAADTTCIQDQAKGMLVEAIQGLPERERVTISLYYLRGLSLKEIGMVLGVTESRVCQIRGQATKRLRKRLIHLA